MLSWDMGLSGLQAVGGVAIFAVLAGAVGYSYWLGETERSKQAAVRAVATLPPGVRENWESYVDERLRAAIVRDGSQLHVTNPLLRKFALGPPTVVSTNTPYSIDCDGLLGGSVSFAAGPEALDIPIFGLLALDEGEPELGVDSHSVAAVNLKEALCPRIAAFMKQITN